MANHVPKVELQLAGTWTDITQYVYNRAAIKIKRGRSGEGSNVDPSTCDLTLDNRGGRFSPRNPLSPYYGLLGRNTPLRVSVSGMDQTSLQISTAGASTPHTAALNVSTDLDLRAEIMPYTWLRSQNIMGKYDFASQLSYILWTAADGKLWLSYSTNGTTATNVGSTAVVPRGANRRFAVRAVLSGSFGGVNTAVAFYFADSISGPWYQLGDTTILAGTTSVWAGTAPLQVGLGTMFSGRVYKAEVRTGVGATTLVASPDFTAQTPGASSFVDAQSRTWTVAAGGALSTSNVRFIGEVSTWPVRWEEGEDDVYAPIQASGVLRRLLANVPPLRSVLRRSLPSLANLKAYWPMEDASGATSFAYGLTDPTGTYAMGMFLAPSPAAYSAFVASDPIPTFGSGAYTKGKVPSYSGTSALQVRCLINIPSGGAPADGTTLVKITCSSSTWSLQYKTGGAMQLAWTDTSASGGSGTIGPVSFSLDGKNLRLSIELTQAGANVTANMATLVPGATSGSVSGGTATGVVIGRATYVQVGAPGATSSVAIGHVTVENAVTSLFDLGTQLNGYRSETAGTRAARLATEEGYTLYNFGTASTLMGAQTSQSLIDLLRSCQDAEGGILYEPRGVAALGLRSRDSMAAQDVAFTMNYAAQQVHDIDPTDDDQNITNDVVITRTLGSSYEVSLDLGNLSTLAPPNGIGRYQQASTLALYTDAQLRDVATYRLALGTVDEPRYPVIGAKLHAGVYTASPALCRAALDIEVGDILQVTNLPTFYSPFDAYQRVEGYTETITTHTYDIAYNCSPGALWRGQGIYNDPTSRSRYDSDGSTLTGAITAGATSVSVTVADGGLWTTTDVPFQVVVGGEVMTVTAVSGGSSPQTFTVTRAVNGISKAQTAGTSVHVYTPSYYGY